MFKEIKRIIVGQPLLSHHAADEKIPKWKALSTLSSDALSSVAYATDAILLTLAASAAAATIWSIPIAIAISLLLLILTASYRQTIDAYPNGGGAYTVAKENLGTTAGLIAGAALLIDYVLTVSVSVASGVENISSAIPWTNDHKELIGTLVIIIITFLNLRGIRESATIFAFPTYFFIFSIFIMVGTGLFQLAMGTAVTAPAPPTNSVFNGAIMILILRAFASGCSALTGVEAISNGVSVFRPPAAKNAKITLVWMSVLLGALFMGITITAHYFHTIPTEDQTLISMLGRSIYGGGSIPYYLTQAATALILFLAANTSYADFPRLASLLARDRFLPRQLASLGDRLVFSNGIIGLSLTSIFLLILFRAESIRLLPLYAIGVFLSFTLSQSGMVAHHIKEKEPGWRISLVMNAIGALTTFVVLIDIASTKFFHGAWLVVMVIPCCILFFGRIHKHYFAVGAELSLYGKQPPAKFEKVEHTVIIPISGIHQGVLVALQYALSISTDVRACYVEIDPEKTKALQAEWERWVPGVAFVVLKSPYRSVVQPLIDYLDDVEQCSHGDMITVVVPEFITKKWWHRILHNQTALVLRAALAFRPRRVVTSVRYHLKNT